jgi:pimeloyl-ACP methyl ester carboxylesterase
VTPPSRRRLLGAGAALALLGAAAGGVGVRSAYADAIAAARTRIGQGSRMIDTRAGPIEVAITPGQRPLLMIHGTGGGFDQGLLFARRLVDAGWQVIAPSRFGYLRTPFPADASSEAQADAFAALLDALGIERLPVIGGSAGALPAIAFALRHPQRCSALVPIVPATHVPGRPATPAAAPWLVPITEAALRSDFLFWSALRIAPRAMIGALLATDPALLDAAPADERGRVERILWEILPVSERADGLLNDARLASNPAPMPIEQIRVPTLTISCEDDRFGTAAAARHIAATVPGARLRMFPAGGHVWVGHDAELFAEVGAFLAPA